MQTLKKSTNLDGAVVSEKLEGIQGVGDRQRLTTRTGNEIHAPGWWLARYR